MLSRILYHWRRLVLVDEQTQLVGGRTLEIDFERERTPELALNAEAVLVDVRATKGLIFCTQTYYADLVGFANVVHERNVLIEPDPIGELIPVLGSGTTLRCGQVVGRIKRHVRRDIVENLVIAHAESTAEHGLVVSKNGTGEPRGIGKTDDGSKVVLVRVHAGIGERKGGLRKEQRSGTALGSVNGENLVAAQ